MSAGGSSLAPLASTHDLRLVCARCSVRQREVTYAVRPVEHKCERDLLLCRARGGRKWRPVSRRPAFPNPSQYQVCRYYVEDQGCSVHRNRCTFARSDEEAAVWTFEKHHKLDHTSLRRLVAQSEGGLDRGGGAEPQRHLVETLDLTAACSLCASKEQEITYALKPVSHECRRDLLFAKTKTSQHWRPVSERPTGGHFGQSVLFQVCHYFVENSGCTEHGDGCTFARSLEEAAVWNYVRDHNMDNEALIGLLAASEPVTAEGAARRILQEFSGEFIELCGSCFQHRPSKLACKRWNDTCSEDEAHRWDPVLVHHLSENGRKELYNQVRPLPRSCSFEYCSHVREGRPCWHQAGHCKCAQSEVEMAVWRAEHCGLAVRPHLLQLSRREQAQPSQVVMYCKVCLLTLSSGESFFRHCSSLEHAQLLSEGTSTTWRGRLPPHNRRADFRLCERPQTCEYGARCQKAHSVEELQEWLMRAAEDKEVHLNMEAQGLMSYKERLLEEYKNSSNEVHVISEQVDDVSIVCDADLPVECEQAGEVRQWNFHVETERRLLHVALLKQEPGASFSLDDIEGVPCIYSSGQYFLGEDMAYDLTVSFKCANPGLYEQWLVLDFGTRPVLLRKLRVRVGQLPLNDPEQLSASHSATLENVRRWNRGNRVIIPGFSRTEEQEALLKEYKPPQINFLYKSSFDRVTRLSHENYKEKMHHFLYSEELAQDQVVSRLNVCGEIATLDMVYSPRDGMMIAPPGELFCAVSVLCSLTLDTPEGLILKRSIHSGLIAPLSSHGRNGKVYEAKILLGNTSENKIYLQLHKKCCSDLSLKKDESYQMEVQFQLERYSFCSMHKAVDLLPDTKRVLPQLKNCEVPANDVKYETLNTKQQAAVSFITGKSSGQQFVAPLLIYGPFGTGKTFTLAMAARELSKEPKHKVLICTHTNSSADLYIKVHFHPSIDKENSGMRPVRIKANKQTGLFATDEITLKYCLLSKDGQYFQSPTKAVLDRHNVVITTTSMAKHFQDLKLPEGYFTHILIDEASQMLECEALIALGLAGPHTRVVLAGDHMQMGPMLFSVDDCHRSDYTLLNRLFHFYQGQKCEAAEQCRIILSENYRSTKEIVDFVSTHFYVGKNDIIKATGLIPAPASGHALKFYHVRGQCSLDTPSMSWYNKEEVATVVKAVTEILDQWPSTWGTKDQSSICVLSEGYQIQRIRTALKQSFPKVQAESYANVQGKQFRAVIIVTVQTRDRLQKSDLPGLELFNDIRVINTAMTRAESQVVVVGDAAALCCFGTCSEIWKSYVEHCISNSSVAPQHFTKDFFEKDLKETARFQKFERVHESKMLSDTILQEMIDEYEQLNIESSSDEDSAELKDVDHHKSRASHGSDADANAEPRSKQSETHKHGKLVRESFNRGYVIPFDSPARRITIKGRSNLGTALSGDEVVVQTAREGQAASVLSVTKKSTSESDRVFLCFLEEPDYSKPRQAPQQSFVRRTMVPLTRSAPKICIMINKKKRNFIPVWQQICGRWTPVTFVHLNESRKQNFVFQVEIIGWKEHCLYPLGNVTGIIPIERSLDAALWLLREELQIAPSTFESHGDLCLGDQDRTNRKNLCEIITFTIDPAGAKDLDDAISVRECGDHYQLGVHIADVASFVSPGDGLDERAKERGVTYYCSAKEPDYMFPQDLSTGLFSLLLGKDRSVVSLMFRVQKDTHKIIGTPRFQLSLINSDGQLSYEEAEEIISKRYKESLKFETVQDCVTVAYCFAKAQRKIRLRDWPYAQTDDHRLPGKRKAHLMIEELNVLFNSYASETLLASSKTSHHAPLRCQAKPDQEKVSEFKVTCRDLIPLSFHVRHKVSPNKKAPSCENVRLLKEVWKAIQSAAKVDDTDQMVDLVAADDIHPFLQPVIDAFRECQSRAYIIRSRSSHKADVGHYSVNKKYYTQASSPIRRYMDVVLQRLLHSVICDRDVPYTSAEIDSFCDKFERNLQDSKMFEQKAEQLTYAVSMKKQSASKLVFIISAYPDEDSFSVSFPFNKSIFSKALQIMYKDLQLDDIPSHDDHCTTLKWKRRIYAADDAQVRQELKMWPNRSSPCVELPVAEWRAIVEAIDSEQWDRAKLLVMNGSAKQLENQMSQPSEAAQVETKKSSPEDHLVDISLQLQPGDTLQIQMTCKETKRFQNLPAVQLLHVKPKFEICVDHIQSPITCFARSADEPARHFYHDVDEYVCIWQPLCNMESVATAVDETDSIVIENQVVIFNQQQEGKLSGSFSLPEAWKNDWAVEFKLSRCLLCIRKRGLKMSSAAEHSALVDPREFTWVAHGVTSKVLEMKTGECKVEFYVTHLPMETKPKCVFQKNTTFTVEIIPKLLPDIRKEDAILRLQTACNLVKSIALGNHCPKKVLDRSVLRLHIMRTDLSSYGMPKLNDSQYVAVEQAINKDFTLIQGPPGTGKTVVGVYMVYWFAEQNPKNRRIFVDEKDRDKKEVVLYCGPSNKSVDVVAEFLMRLGDKVKPLRVYSQQVETLDYPHPDFKSTPRALRQDRSKEEIRNITLHHRIRQEHNPSSHRIKEFDRRIAEKTELTTEEVKAYNDLLKEARAYELERHDIILCTCTHASAPSLTKVVSARQILIDECAMATEPQALIPLVCNNPERIVLIGDHKQLQPIVKNESVRKLGVARSLFERCYTNRENSAVMLDTQYRMHEDICEFPSKAYYSGKLKTGAEQPPSVLRVNKRTMPIVFGHIQGKTIHQVTKTAKGNFNSKVNHEEKDKVIDIATKLVKAAKVKQQDIVILSPYNAQVAEIQEELKKRKMSNVLVTTITKSQGSEWRYVIISTVCSLPTEEIEPEQGGAWMSKHLGFVGYATQINVGITRAKEGLCIIGNQELLRCSLSWKKLLDHYQLKNAVTNADKISVRG